MTFSCVLQVVNMDRSQFSVSMWCMKTFIFARFKISMPHWQGRLFHVKTTHQCCQHQWLMFAFVLLFICFVFMPLFFFLFFFLLLLLGYQCILGADSVGGFVARQEGEEAGNQSNVDVLPHLWRLQNPQRELARGDRLWLQDSYG